MTDKRCKIHPGAEPKLQVNEVGSRHYGKWICSECDKWLTHAKNPGTSQALAVRQGKIREMLLESIFSDDDLKKLLPLYSTAHLNLVQQNIYDTFLLRTDV